MVGICDIYALKLVENKVRYKFCIKVVNVIIRILKKKKKKCC